MNVHEPVFFGGLKRLAGSFTRGNGTDSTRRAGVLLCPPLGHEYMCSQRAFRRLARDLGRKGFAVLRFDYPGTGNSESRVAIDAESESLVPAWIESISIAADELRRLSGCETLAFVGLRLGATLAVAAAASRTDVESLVIWSPCVDGRSLVRQTRMLAVSAAEHPGDLASESDGLESAGFLLGRNTVSDIVALNFQAIRFSARDALVLTRDDGPAETRLVDRLVAAGVVCEEERYTNHGSFMVSPLHSVLPTAAIATVVDWVDAHHPVVPIDSRLDHASVSSSTNGSDTSGVRESWVKFSRGSLVGVLTEPERRTGQPAVILLNTGADHNVGPHRMYVPLARRWADLGFPVLRFDLAGLGDSKPNEDIPTSESYPDAALDDIRAAVEFMRTEREYPNVLLAGICSGAYHAIHAADALTVGIIAVNPPLYYRRGDPIDDDPYSNEVETRRVTRALRSPAKWRRLVTGRVDFRYSLSVLVGRVYVASRAAAAAVRKLVTTNNLDRRDATELFHEGVATHLVFSDGDASQIFFERAIAPRMQRFRDRENFTVDVVSGADHTFMPIKWQRVLADLMTQRLLQHRAVVPASPLPLEYSSRESEGVA
ncbi:MAG TPA: alpha/beta fold hydrolase [Gemmatimonadaceae bacterium]